MYHTTYLYLPMDGLYYSHLFKALHTLSIREGKKFFKSQTKKDCYECHLFQENGILIYLRSTEYTIGNNHVHYHAIEIRMNPKMLLKQNEYIQISKFDDYPVIEQMFFNLLEETQKNMLGNDAIVNQFSPINSIATYKVNRIDYCVNLFSTNADQYIKLIEKADIPKRFAPVKAYDSKSKRKKLYKSTYYVKNKSVCLNFYDKHYQLLQVKDDILAANANGIIRFEVQCEKSKLENLCRKHSISNSLYHLSNDELSHNILIKYYVQSIGLGDYYTLTKAKEIIHDAQNYTNKKKQLMITILNLVSQKKYVWKARKESNICPKKFDKTLKHLTELRINPVTIPSRWKVQSLPNLLPDIMKVLKENKSC
ncbi:hypothetical protein OCB16_03350 [Bacillus cereus]|uniref:hypothetical protein n=1 Tax=Bacillus cereus group TaxID=86661 RepID=UPI0007AB6145|nr:MULTISPECIES: hypothetical protein [Bacillus cereus group]KZD30939.1 hypothetical protein B4081_3747 [Bacillus cereus]MCC6082740.1 hypothetical protein [Bacillus thuringiensis]MCU5658282.1 hypothetical protein [Bacillus cereus]MCU5719413.1 hypothetical protein [Bacillus cereus]